MRLPLRVFLAVLGLLLCLCATGALLYVVWPVETVRDAVPLAPTLFAPPGAALLGWLRP